ncbi:unnamed protein product [Diamesa serratosioi]
MKVFVVLFAVFCAIQATSASADVSSLSELIGCVSDKIDRIVGTRNHLVDWKADVIATIQRLYDQRERCNKIPRSDPITTIQQRLIDACDAAFTASVIYEGNRLKNGLYSSDEGGRQMATDFYRAFLECFNVVDPDME